MTSYPLVIALELSAVALAVLVLVGHVVAVVLAVAHHAVVDAGAVAAVERVRAPAKGLEEGVGA